MREMLSLGQTRRDQTSNRSQLQLDIDKKIDEFNAVLITDNNNATSDTAVNDVLITLLVCWLKHPPILSY